MNLIDNNEDMAWLFSTHLSWMAQFARKFKSAVLYGNEDAPTRIDLYVDSQPTISDLPTIVTL